MKILRMIILISNGDNINDNNNDNINDYIIGYGKDNFKGVIS